MARPRYGPPSTWQRYRVDGNHDGAADVYDPEDAIPSAANYLHILLARPTATSGRRSSPTAAPPPTSATSSHARAPTGARPMPRSPGGRVTHWRSPHEMVVDRREFLLPLDQHGSSIPQGGTR